jgi:hypothetical protein
MLVSLRGRLSVGGLALLSTVAFGASACGSSSDSGDTPATTKPATSSKTAAATSSASSSTDLAALVIKPEDIPIPGFTQKSSTPVSESGANGVAVLFANADDTRELGDTILVLPDETAASAAMQAAVTATQGQVTGGTATPVQVGDGGTVVTGAQAGKASTVLIFQQGKALVVMQFDSAPADPVPADLATTVGQKQADKIKSGLTE